MLPLWLLLPLVDGVSQNVSDYCKEMRARTPQRANVVLALRGESFRNGAGQATIHTCCPSSYVRQREVFTSHKAFIEQLSARGFGTTRLLATTYACSRAKTMRDLSIGWFCIRWLAWQKVC